MTNEPRIFIALSEAIVAGVIGLVPGLVLALLLLLFSGLSLAPRT